MKTISYKVLHRVATEYNRYYLHYWIFAYTMAVSQDSVESTSNTVNRGYCRFANKGVCPFQDNECQYRHEKCENYNLCLKPSCLLAHASPNLTEIGKNTQRNCKNGLECYNFNCKFQHPEGWSACRNGAACTIYGCNSEHPPPPPPKKLCRFGDNCRNKSNYCPFLHPNENRNEEVQKTNYPKPKLRGNPVTFKTVQENPSNPPGKQLSETIEFTPAKLDYLARFGNEILSEIRKQADIKGVKLNDGKLQLDGTKTAITGAKSYLEKTLHEENVTIAANLLKYLQLSAKERLIEKFIKKHHVGVHFRKVSTNEKITTENMVTNKDNDDDDDISQSDSDDDDSDNRSVTSNASSCTTTVVPKGKDNHKNKQNFVEVTLCSISNDSLSKAIKELQGYTLSSQSWLLTQDEMAYILKEPQKRKNLPKKPTNRDNCNQVKFYFLDLIRFNPNVIVQIFVNYQRNTMRVQVKGFKNHVRNSTTKIKAHLADNIESEVQLPISKAMEIFLRKKAASDVKKLEKTTRIKITLKSSRRAKPQTSVENFLERLLEQEKQFPCQSWDIAKIISKIICTRLKTALESDDYDAIGWVKTYTSSERRAIEPNIAVAIVSFNQEAVDDIVEQFQNTIDGYVVWKPSADEFRAIFHTLIVKKTPSAEEFRQQWETNVQFDRDTNTVTIPASSKQVADDIKDALLNLGADRKIQMKRITEFIPIPLNARRFINQAIGPILEEAKSQKVFVETKTREGLKLHGPSDVIAGFKQKIKLVVDDITQKIVKSLVHLTSAETDLFRADGYKVIRSIERQTNTIIHDVMATTNSSRLATNENPDASVTLACVENSRRQTILVKKEDITQVENIDAIINAANGTLQHAGGVDKTIANAAGPALDQECKRLITENNGLPFAAGEAVKTTAGNLPFKCVIHAIGPQFSNGNQQERPLLFNSILASLRLAERERCKSVALPAISSQTFGFPLSDCTNLVVRAVKQFYADYPQSVLKRIVLLDTNDATCNSFAREVVVDHRSALTEDDDIFNYQLAPLTAKWCWQGDDGEKIYDENHTRQIETAFQQFLKTSTAPTLVIPADNLRIGKIVNYKIHFLPELKQSVTNIATILNGRLVCGSQIRESTGFKRNIIRYPIVLNIKTTTSATATYVPKPLDSYNIQTVTKDNRWEITGINNSALTEAERAIRKAINDATITEPYSVKLDKDITEHKQQINNIATQQHIQISFEGENAGHLSMIMKGLKSNVQDAKLKITLYAHDILQKKVENENELSIPKEWGDQQEGCKLVETNRTDSEFTRIEKCMKETMNNVNIHKIERVQNVRMWSHYAFRRQQLKKELCLKPNLQIEMELFHGTRTTPPNEVYNGEYGFDMTFSTSGMWGIGSYFAKNASYSCPSYSHKLPNGQYQAFFAQVLTGDIYDCKSDSTLRRPPKKNESTSGLRYNSVSGDTGGSKVYIIYENRVAYPTYLITFTP
ncbi:unnamed protein product [Didymodactylos carnosus]|uniref:Poly [ADP-ribose] polymerase n=1 Tax=Didymodactylos carnosus TaxID=1234261 RepID=A0A815C8H4_9BILA|nr:unnamed protein product [Didymodactylos carnosus]CAF4083959.1 unnamed protein product [Didymodactylos carnosus]